MSKGTRLVSVVREGAGLRLPHAVVVLIVASPVDDQARIAWGETCVGIRRWCTERWGSPNRNTRWGTGLSNEFFFADSNDAFEVKMRFG